VESPVLLVYMSYFGTSVGPQRNTGPGLKHAFDNIENATLALKRRSPCHFPRIAHTLSWILLVWY